MLIIIGLIVLEAHKIKISTTSAQCAHIYTSIQFCSISLQLTLAWCYDQWSTSVDNSLALKVDINNAGTNDRKWPRYLDYCVRVTCAAGGQIACLGLRYIDIFYFSEWLLVRYLHMYLIIANIASGHYDNSFKYSYTHIL